MSPYRTPAIDRQERRLKRNFDRRNKKSLNRDRRMLKSMVEDNQKLLNWIKDPVRDVSVQLRILCSTIFTVAYYWLNKVFQ